MNHVVCIRTPLSTIQYNGWYREDTIITLTNLIRAYAAFVLDEPHRTTRNFKALLDKVGTTISAQTTGRNRIMLLRQRSIA